jgi:hypothetical protein
MKWTSIWSESYNLLRAWPEKIAPQSSLGSTQKPSLLVERAFLAGGKLSQCFGQRGFCPFSKDFKNG